MTEQVKTERDMTASGPEPLVVRPKEAWLLLGCGNTYGYGLIKSGSLETYRDGRARKITMASIRRHIERRLERI